MMILLAPRRSRYQETARVQLMREARQERGLRRGRVELCCRDEDGVKEWRTRAEIVMD